MLSVQSATPPPKSGRPELPPLRQPSPAPRPTLATPIMSAVPGGAEGLDHWFQELQKYEATLGAMATASEDPKFREELSTIEQWFKLLNESEQTASLYTLLQHANQAQVKFLAAVLTQMSNANDNAAAAENAKSKQNPRSLRPPSLNLPMPASPATPYMNTPVSAVTADAEKLSLSIPEGTAPAQDAPVNNAAASWANEVNTPLVRMFPKGAEGKNAPNVAVSPAVANLNPAAGVPLMNPFNMAMLNQMGFSNEAQLLAVQMVMSGLVQPGNVPGQKASGRPPNSAKASGGNNWRAPNSAKYPSSALRTGGLKTGGLKSSGLRSSGLRSATPLASAGATPKDSEDIDPELLKDVPAWLKSLRLHKYTACFDGMTWEQMVELDEPTLEAKGIVALGARRRLIKTFDLVKLKMGMEVSTPVADQVPNSALLPGRLDKLDMSFPGREAIMAMAPHSAAPTFS